MFRSPKLFFVYLAWFVGVILIIYGVFNLVYGSLYLAIPETRKVISFSPISPFFGVPPVPIGEEIFAEDPMMFVPPQYQKYVEHPEDIEKLSPEERKKFDEAYKKAEKKAEDAKKLSKKLEKEYTKAQIILTFAKGIVGIILGIPLALITWILGKREKGFEEES